MGSFFPVAAEPGRPRKGGRDWLRFGEKVGRDDFGVASFRAGDRRIKVAWCEVAPTRRGFSPSLPPIEDSPR